MEKYFLYIFTFGFTGERFARCSTSSMQNILRVQMCFFLSRDGFHSISKGVSFVLPKPNTVRSRGFVGEVFDGVFSYDTVFQTKAKSIQQTGLHVRKVPFMFWLTFSYFDVNSNNALSILFFEIIYLHHYNYPL